MSGHFRQEHKYLISNVNCELLKHRLSSVMGTDSHAKQDGSYFIRSMYFDDVDFSAYREKLNGEKYRSKYRVRYYNFDPSFIIFEKKERDGDLCKKTTVRISPTLAQRLVNGRSSGSSHPLLREFDRLRSTKGLRPAVIVDYDRFAFFHPYSDTRVTLDTKVRTPAFGKQFFSDSLGTFPVLDEGESILEFKFDEEPPIHVVRVLEGIPKIKTAMSKYTRCLDLLND